MLSNGLLITPYIWLSIDSTVSTCALNLRLLSIKILRSFYIVAYSILDFARLSFIQKTVNGIYCVPGAKFCIFNIK